MNNEWIKVFAPGSVANVGPGFDILGFAIENIGDLVEIRRSKKKGVRIVEIMGDNGKLSYDPDKNTTGIAAKETLKLINPDVDVGVEIKLKKGLPLESGFGSSGASAVAGAMAVNVLFGNILEKKYLLEPCLKAEATVSGYHADNVAPSLFGGFVLIKDYNPLEVISLGGLEGLYCVLIHPDLCLNTKKARAILPKKIPIRSWVHNAGNTAAIVAGVLLKNPDLVGRAVNDIIVEPARARLIPGFLEVKKAALAAGASGCSISGSGPSVFAFTTVVNNLHRIGMAMKEAFEKKKIKAHMHFIKINEHGAQVIKSQDE